MRYGIVYALLAVGLVDLAVFNAAMADKPAPAQPVAPRVVRHQATTRSLPPAPLPAPRLLRDVVHFKPGAQRLKVTNISTLENLLLDIDPKSIARIVLTGSADPSGSKDFNRRLSLNRAWSVADFFTSKGVPPAAIELRALGEPSIASTDRKEDRRVEIEIVLR